MKQISWIILQSVALLFLYLLFCANAAQPGVWNAGGGGFTFLFPEDSTAFRKIRMQSEAINIQLYPGFAVVKGTYQMQNTTGDTIVIKVGYPVQGIYDSEHRIERNEITFDGLYQLRVIQDGKERAIIEAPLPKQSGRARTYDNDNWYVWESVFLPNAQTAISVYFMVNTNSARITEGYARDHHNAFLYILESGRIWQPPIGEAVFRIQCMEDLAPEDIHGISPGVDFDLLPTQKLLFGKKNDFIPMPEDNLLINYGREVKPFDFAAKTTESERYFTLIDELAHIPVEADRLISFEEADPYRVQQSTPLPWISLILLFGLPALLLLGGAIWIFRLLRAGKS